MSTELDNVREGKKHIWPYFVIVLILVGMSFFGVSSFFTGANQQGFALKLGSQTVSANEYNNALSNAQRRSPNADLKTLRPYINQQFINQLLIKDYASNYAFITSEKYAKEIIAQTDAFQLNGAFDADMYVQALRENGLSSKQYIASLQNNLAIGKLLSNVSSSSITPEQDVISSYVMDEASLNIRFIKLLSKDYLAGVPTPEKVKSYYDTHPEVFQSLETVAIDYFLLSADLLKADAPADANTLYQAYVVREKSKRLAANYLLFSKKEAAQVAQQQARQESFAVAQTSAKGTPDFLDNGRFAERDSKPEALASALASLSKQGDITEVIQTEDGFFVLQLDSIMPQIKPLAEIEAELLASETERLKTEKFEAEKSKLEEQVFAEGATLESIAKAFALPIEQTGDLVLNGTQGLLANNVFATSLRGELASGQLEVGKLATPVVDDKQVIVYQLKTHQKPSLLPFAEVESKTKGIVQRNDNAESLKAGSDELIVGIKEKGFVNTAAEKGLMINTLAGLKQKSDDQLLDAVAKFGILQADPELGEAAVAVVQDMEGNNIVYVVDDVVLPGLDSKVLEKTPNYQRVHSELLQAQRQEDANKFLKVLQNLAKIKDRTQELTNDQ